MKAIVFSDLHLSNFKSKFKLNEYGVSDLLVRQMRFAHYLVEVAKKEGCDTMLFLGDFTDYEVLDPITLNYATDFISLLDGHFDNLIWLEGNHCISDSANQNTVLSAFVDCFKKSKFVIHPCSIGINGINFHCLPYLSDYDAAIEWIEQINDQCKDSRDKNILLFHFPTTNALLDNSIKSTKGLTFDKSIVGNFDLCLGGDFHRHQALMQTDNAYYVGSPFTLSYGEEPEKGFLVLSLDDLSFKRVSNPFDVKQVKCKSLQVEGQLAALSDQGIVSADIILQVEDLSDAQFDHLSKRRDEFYALHLRKEKRKIEVKPVENKSFSLRDYLHGIDDEASKRIGRVISQMESEVAL